MGFIYFGKERKLMNEIGVKKPLEKNIERMNMVEKINGEDSAGIQNWYKMQQLQDKMYENNNQILGEQFEKERKRREFEAIVKADEESKKKQLEEYLKERQKKRYEIIRKNRENKEALQNSLLECSKTLREIQQSVKDTYMFTPCKQMCELLNNIRSNVYQNIGDIREDFEDVVYAFGINEFKPLVGEVFDAKYHNQVYSNVPDARGKKISKVYSSGFEMDGEIIIKASVSVEEIMGGSYE